MSYPRLPGTRPPRPLGRHLGDRAAALVDGDLVGPERDSSLAHVAGCDACRAEVEGQRAMHAVLRRLPALEPDGALMAALLGMDHPGQYPPGTGSPGQPPSESAEADPGGPISVRPEGPAVGSRRPSSRGRRASARPRSGVRGRRPSVGATGRHRAGAFALGAMSVIAAALGSAVAVGGGATTTPAPVLGGPSPAVTVSAVSRGHVPARVMQAGTMPGFAPSTAPALIDPASVAVAVSFQR